MTVSLMRDRWNALAEATSHRLQNRAGSLCITYYTTANNTNFLDDPTSHRWVNGRNARVASSIF